jgi:hypothetical protein
MAQRKAQRDKALDGCAAVCQTTGRVSRHPFGITVLRPDGQLDTRYGRGGYCRANLAGGPSAAGVAVVGARLIGGGEGAPGSWLLDCPSAP